MKIQTTLLLSGLGLGIAAMLPSASQALGGGSQPTIAEIAGNSDDFDTLTAALGAANLTETLDGPGPFTVFAPTDAAFDALPAGVVSDLLLPQNKDDLTTILTYHVLSGEVLEATAITLPFATSLNGQRIPFAFDPSMGFFVDGAMVTMTDIQASNGVIHVIDMVMMPETGNLLEVAADAGGFDTLRVALRATGLKPTIEQGGPFTVFAPNDAAFADLPAGTLNALLAEEDFSTLTNILGLHVVPGRIYSDQLMGDDLSSLIGEELRFRDNGTHIGIGGAKIVASDIEAENGVIHVLDKVLSPMD